MRHITTRGESCHRFTLEIWNEGEVLPNPWNQTEARGTGVFVVSGQFSP